MSQEKAPRIITCQLARKEPDKTDYHMQTYEVKYREGMTVLDLMRTVADEIDGSFAFYDHACKRGFCGSCLVKLNGRNSLSCRTLVPGDDNVLVLEPAMPTTKDFWPEDPA
ncbi:2Fe-2S iron-sulfur cluster-binding protein [Paenibacillus senegalensis]|uniref:2Fe-2S iron-sulfur cluster-binding protein n=1 Tax=Paenibacillus senegalensis TaxID=1465766 RepID=UPI000289D5B7|nr:2Fe-2S iron-sulfur cluster-binding protein [Paenibacillus senegalensis]